MDFDFVAATLDKYGLSDRFDAGQVLLKMSGRVNRDRRWDSAIDRIELNQGLHFDDWKRLGRDQMGQKCGRGWQGLRGACKRVPKGGDKEAAIKASKMALADRIRKKKGLRDRNAPKARTPALVSTRAAYESKYGKAVKEQKAPKISQFDDLTSAVDAKIRSFVVGLKSNGAGEIDPKDSGMVRSLSSVKSKLDKIYHKKDLFELYSDGARVETRKQGAVNRRVIVKNDEIHSSRAANTGGLEAITEAFKLLGEPEQTRTKAKNR